MATKKTASPNGTIDLATLSPGARRYEWFEMPQADDDDAEPFRVKAQRLTATEMEAIPAGKAKFADVVADFRRYLVAWNLTATTDSGEVVPVMPPAEMDDDSIRIALDRLLYHDQLVFLYNVLKQGHVLKMLAEGKALTRFADTPAPSPEGGSKDGT